MTRWLVTISLLAGTYVAGDWLFSHPGEVQVTWFGYEIALHIGVLGLTLLALAVLVGLFSIQIWKLVTWPSRRKTRIQHRTFKRGLEQLTRGVAALAMGNEAVAEEAIRKALTALPGEPLPQLLSAQLLQRQGKHADAQLQFKALMDHSATAELATRRLIEQHVSRKEWREATRLAEEARSKTPRDRWLALTLIDFYARDGRTSDMLTLTEGWQWQSPLSKEERHRYGALAYYLAARAEAAPRLKEKNLRHAVGYAPDLLPATVDYAYALLAEENPRRARKWLLESWKKAPSALLIEPILEAVKAASPRAQNRLLRPFTKGDGAVHHLLAARQAIRTGEVTDAKNALEDVLLIEENKEAATLMADLEHKLRNDDAAEMWLRRALEAPQASTWVCIGCGHTHKQWDAHCSQCDGFDTLRYERPNSRSTSLEAFSPARTANAI
jgi:HemY protein